MYSSFVCIYCFIIGVSSPQGNPRVYKALRNELAAVLEELERIEAGNGVDGELLDTIRLIAAIMDGMRED